jgi:hypothetical protein
VIPASDNRPVSELVSDAVNQFAKLVRNELELARAELAVKFGKIFTGAGLLGAAALFTIPALVLLLLALGAWLEELGLSSPLAFLVAGIVGLILVAVLAAIGIGRLKAETLIPNRTIDQLQRDVAAAKELV